MPVTAQLVAPRDLLAAVGDLVGHLKGAQPLQPVSVVVPTNAVGVTTRRWLGRSGGIAAVDMLTMRRVAEVIGGPALAVEGRQPLSAPVIDLTIESVLADRSTPFNAVRQHPSTIAALRELYQEVRLAGPTAMTAIGAGRTRGTGEVLSATLERLAPVWYDEGDLFEAAIAGVASLPEQLQRLVVCLYHPLEGLELDLVVALAKRADIAVVAPTTEHAELDADYDQLWQRLGVMPVSQASPASAVQPTVITATDADTEVRAAVARLVDAARSGTPFGRMAVLWPANEPYARLVEQHLNQANVPWNGRPGTNPIERIVPRFLLDLLAVDRGGLRRESLFEMLADVPARTAAGDVIPVAHWERVSRAAGVARDDDWTPRLRSYAHRMRARAEHRSDDGDVLPDRAAADADAADALVDFVTELRTELGFAQAARPWAEWAAWAEHQLDRRLGADFLGNLNQAEHLAREHTARVLERLATLDQVSADPTRSKFRSVFEAEFDVAPGRLGRLGEGVTVGHLSSPLGFDLDLVIVLGAADGILPPPPRSGPLVSGDDRERVGLAPATALGRRMQRQFVTQLAAAPQSLVTSPRGDLRASTERFISRWVERLPATHLASHLAFARDVTFPADPQSFRLQQLLRMPSAIDAAAEDDHVLGAALRMRAARRSPEVTAFDGDIGSLTAPTFDRPVSATQLETWPSCPHAYFMRYVLGVRPVDDPTRELTISHLEVGNLVHEVLDRLHREVLVGQLEQPVSGWREQHLQRAVEIFAEVADDYERMGRTGRPASWAARRRDMLADLLVWLHLDGEMLRADGAEVVASEYEFGRDGSVFVTVAPADTAGDRAGGPSDLPVFGKIDRVVRTADGQLRVVDYKTGRSDATRDLTIDDPTAAGTKFQLPLYAAAARASFGATGAPIGVEYSYFNRGRYARHGYVVDTAVEHELGRRLARVLHGIQTGFFPAIPDEPTLFRPFPTCHYCQPDGLGLADRYGELLVKLADGRFAEHGLVEVETDDEVPA